ncbi:DUF2264 domain-containing protein [Pedobacter panaciterrae]
MRRRKFIEAMSFATAAGVVSSTQLLAAEYKANRFGPYRNDREYWCELLYKIASPVVSNLASGTLKKNMPLEKSPTFDSRSLSVTYLEAVGRTYAGIAPWIALQDDNTREAVLRKN